MTDQAKAEDDITDNEGGESPPDEKTGAAVFCECLKNFYWTNEFLILIVVVILLALAYPPIGAIYLAPQITATWIAVMIIFLLAGLGLKTEEFKNALKQCKFNSFVLIYNLGVESSFVYGVSRGLLKYNIINKDLANGMVITACLPMTINMCVVLTQASGGDVAASICNTAIGNMVGVFLSPVLILGYLGVTGDVNILTVFIKLASRVLFPIVVGQVLKCYSKAVVEFAKTYKPYFKRIQMYSLVFIVYTVFCKTFISDENTIPVKDVFIMIAFIFICLSILMVVAWYLLRLLFSKEVKLRVTGLYTCTHKTVAMGVPMINAIYEGDPALGMYTLPLLIWHPMQLVIGSLLSPRLQAWVDSCEIDAAEEEAKTDDAPEKDSNSVVSMEIEA